MIRCPHYPADSLLAEAFGRWCGPGAHEDSPSNWQSLWRLRLTAPASVASPPGPGPLCPGRVESWSLRPTLMPAPMRHSGPWRPDGGTGHSGNNRAPDELEETGPDPV